MFDKTWKLKKEMGKHAGGSWLLFLKVLVLSVIIFVTCVKGGDCPYKAWHWLCARCPHAFFRSSGQFGPQQLILCWSAGPVAFRSVANACTSFFCWRIACRRLTSIIIHRVILPVRTSIKTWLTNSIRHVTKLLMHNLIIIDRSAKWVGCATLWRHWSLLPVMQTPRSVIPPHSTWHSLSNYVAMKLAESSGDFDPQLAF